VLSTHLIGFIPLFTHLRICITDLNETSHSETEKVKDESGTIDFPFLPFLCGLMLVTITLKKKSYLTDGFITM